jgi:NADH:ubiquinone oxidoreductase subunit 4 (subunit M)
LAVIVVVVLRRLASASNACAETFTAQVLILFGVRSQGNGTAAIAIIGFVIFAAPTLHSVREFVFSSFQPQALWK